MVERLKMYINKLVAYSVDQPNATINFRSQAYGALMFVLEGDTTLTEDEKTDLCNFWDKAMATFTDIYNNYYF